MAGCGKGFWDSGALQSPRVETFYKPDDSPGEEGGKGGGR